MEKKYEIPEAEEIKVQIEDNFLQTMVVDPIHGGEEGDD